ncbi:MAG: molybdopterin-guanine dinucleotide biosynthesis protein B [Gemmatimonadales bacterium]|nr:molybdopterin-guanine dinucleotide biosynthesis protein B [Gemmatimonadales bacterium]MBP9200320.1 molybdopterin-guanine dinucleotide biosynthesis protein B [Gemmatimonadales bacterium]
MTNEVPLRPDPLPLPAVGFVGSSGSGKTTLITAVLPCLREAGLRVAVLKHARHGFDMDQPGKDSYRARAAGAAEVLVASRSRWVLLGECEGERDEPPFRELLARFDRSRVDLVLVEGFAGEAVPKIEVYRPAHGEPPKCWPTDPRVVAVATDAPLDVAPPAHRLDLNAADAVARFVLAHLAATADLPVIHAA